MLQVDYLAGADSDIQEHFNRHEDYRDGFGVELLLAIDEHVTYITEFPRIAPIYFETMRRLVMKRFPLGIFYENHPTRILVYAVLDLRQDEESILRQLRF